MTTSTAKIKLQSKTEHEGDDAQVMLVFRADYNDERNKEWAFYTPVLAVNMTVRKGTALAGLKPGQAVTLLFEPEDEATAE